MADIDYAPLPTTAQFMDLTGQQYGRLTVLGFMGRPKKPGPYHWHCQCECGNRKTIRGDHLRSGKVVACGCFRLEQTAKAKTTHGMSRSPEINSYRSAKLRCTNPNDDRYSDYGGRGIKFLFMSFEHFYETLGPRPKGTSLDRINNNGPYSESNCKWSTQQEQALNQRRSVLLLVGGEWIPQNKAIDKWGTGRAAFYQRMKSKWCEHCMSKPVKYGQRNVCQHNNPVKKKYLGDHQT